MITGELKSKIDKVWDTLWTGGISSPTSALEQVTYLMFMKLLDDNEIKKEGTQPLSVFRIKVKFSKTETLALTKQVLCTFRMRNSVGAFSITPSRQ